MSSRCGFNKSPEIGTFCLLTNKYSLVPHCDEIFLNYFTKNLSNDFPVIQTTIANTSIIGRLCVGNSHGLLLPSTVAEYEIENIANSLPESVQLDVTEESFNALGNVISCNDKIAIVNPLLNAETINQIEDTLMVEAIPFSFDKEGLIGSYTCITNNGGVICNDETQETIEELEGITDIKFTPTHVNQGSKLISAGICANNSTLICGSYTTALEMSVIKKALYIDICSQDIVQQLTGILNIL